MKFLRQLCHYFLILLAGSAAAVQAEQNLAMGPLAQEFELTLEAGRRAEFLGPLFDGSRMTIGVLFAAIVSS